MTAASVEGTLAKSPKQQQQAQQQQKKKKKKTTKKKPATSSGAVSLGLVQVNSGSPDDSFTTRIVALSGRTSEGGGKTFVHGLEPGVKQRPDTFVDLRSRFNVDPKGVVAVVGGMVQSHSISSVDVLLLDFHGSRGSLLGWDLQPVATLNSLLSTFQDIPTRVVILALCDGEKAKFPTNMRCDVLYFFGSVPVVEKTRVSTALVAAAAALRKDEVTGAALYGALSYQDKRLVGLRNGKRGS